MQPWLQTGLQAAPYCYDLPVTSLTHCTILSTLLSMSSTVLLGSTWTTSSLQQIYCQTKAMRLLASCASNSEWWLYRMVAEASFKQKFPCEWQSQSLNFCHTRWPVAVVRGPPVALHGLFYHHMHNLTLNVLLYLLFTIHSAADIRHQTVH